MVLKDDMPPMSELLAEICSWFDTELGQQFIAAEQAVLEQVVPGLFGYHLLQIGLDPRLRFYENSAAGHNFMMLPRVELGMPICALAGSAEDLPFASHCIDAVILHHTLDFAQSPHQVLREVARVLRPGGKLVIVGFNPTSFWGLRRRFMRRPRPVPWRGRFISHRRLQDWLAFLELRELRTLSGFYRPPVRSQRWMSRLCALEEWGARYHASRGAFLVTVACKESLAMTPIKKRLRKRLLGVPVAGSAANHQGGMSKDKPPVSGRRERNPRG